MSLFISLTLIKEIVEENDCSKHNSLHLGVGALREDHLKLVTVSERLLDHITELLGDAAHLLLLGVVDSKHGLGAAERGKDAGSVDGVDHLLAFVRQLKLPT